MTIRSIKQERAQPFPCKDCGQHMFLQSVSKTEAIYYCRMCEEYKTVSIAEMFGESDEE